MDKSKKLQIVMSLAIINTFASPIWGNVHSDLQNKVQIISLESLDIKNAQDTSKNTVKIRSKHLAKLSKLTNQAAGSSTVQPSGTTQIN